MTAKILVAGIGNIFLGDDGFGVEVARRLSQMDLPEHVRVVDYGIRGMHLAYDLAGTGQPLTIMVDATAQGGPPGTVYVIELDTELDTGAAVQPVFDAHGMQPDVVLNLVRMLGERPGRVLLVGCEPQVLDEGIGLSPIVERAVDTAVHTVLDLIAEQTPGNGEELTCAWAYPGK